MLSFNVAVLSSCILTMIFFFPELGILLDNAKGPGVATQSLESPLVLENRHAFQDALHLGNQRNFYQAAAVAEDMEHEGDFGHVLREDHTSFYTLGEFMGPTFVRANSPTDDDSIVEFEETEASSHFRTRSEIPLFYSSARHIQDLKQV